MIVEKYITSFNADNVVVAAKMSTNNTNNSLQVVNYHFFNFDAKLTQKIKALDRGFSTTLTNVENEGIEIVPSIITKTVHLDHNVTKSRTNTSFRFVAEGFYKEGVNYELMANYHNKTEYFDSYVLLQKFPTL